MSLQVLYANAYAHLCPMRLRMHDTTAHTILDRTDASSRSPFLNFFFRAQTLRILGEAMDTIRFRPKIPTPETAKAEKKVRGPRMPFRALIRPTSFPISGPSGCKSVCCAQATILPPRGPHLWEEKVLLLRINYVLRICSVRRRKKYAYTHKLRHSQESQECLRVEPSGVIKLVNRQ